MLVKGKSYDLKEKRHPGAFDFKVRFLGALSRMALGANRVDFTNWRGHEKDLYTAPLEAEILSQASTIWIYHLRVR
jgi:hypothetical protein